MIEEYNKILNDLKEYGDTHLKTMVKLKTPIYNNSIFIKTIDDIDNMDIESLNLFIKNNYNNILNNIFFDQQQSEKYITAFTNSKFLDAFINVTNGIINSGYIIDNTNINKINNICYDYLRLSNKDNNIANKMITLGSIVNHEKLPRLLGLGISINMANLLLIARYSNIDMNICIKRVNFIIINRPKESITTNMIEDIYRIIFDCNNQYYMIFPYIMLDVLPEYDENNINTFWVTPDIEENDSKLSLAALNILENLSSSNIRNTLINYSEGVRIFNRNNVRFSMRKLSYEYSRINNTINNLEDYENIIVP